MDAFNGFNNNYSDGVFQPLMDAEVTGAGMIFLVMQRIGVYGLLGAIVFTGIVMLFPKKGQEQQDLKQRLIRISIGVVLFFGFFTLIGLFGSFLETVLPPENNQQVW